MRKLGILFLLSIIILPLAAERRYYLIREGALPTDVQTVDLRPQQGTTQWTLDNVYRNESARYPLFEKRADSWFQVMVETAYGKRIDWSEINGDWSLCIKLRRTVNYTMTLVLGGVGTANGYKIPTSLVPADGSWVTLTIPLASLPALPAFTNRYDGRLIQLHSDLGFAGDEIGVDFCYLTDDPASLDPGSVQPPKRYYWITNANTPLQTLPCAVEDYSASVDARAQGWMQWSYVSFPYYSMENSMPVTMQLLSTAPMDMTDVTSDWYVIGQLKTNVQGNFVLHLYMPDGRAFTDTLRSNDWVCDNSHWNRIILPLDQMEPGILDEAGTPVLFSLTCDNATAGEWSMGSLMLTNDGTAMDPDPRVPADPAQQTRIYLINDGSDLPAQMTCVDYRLFYTSFLSAGYGNNTTRKAADSYLTLLPTNGWWSIDVSAAQMVDLSMVDASWTLYTRLKTTSTVRPVNLIFYKEGNAQLSRYQLTETLWPVAQNGTWMEFEIPVSDILGSYSALLTYSNARIFSFHSDGGGTAGVEVSMEYLYFAKEGESRPDPVPGEPPVTEPEIYPVPEPEPEPVDAVELINYLAPATKFIHHHQVLIRRGQKIYNLQGVELQL